MRPPRPTNPPHQTHCAADAADDRCGSRPWLDSRAVRHRPESHDFDSRTSLLAATMLWGTNAKLIETPRCASPNTVPSREVNYNAATKWFWGMYRARLTSPSWGIFILISILPTQSIEA